MDGPTFLNVPGHSEKVEFGVLIHFAYQITDSEEEIVVATTRIETMLGDVAVAVHPEDERYQHMVGRTCKHPFLDRNLQILADQFVDREFGTGCVKITPAHDLQDYEVGVRHGLPFVTVIGDEGIITKEGGQFQGMKRFEARAAVLNALKEKGLYRGKEPNKMIVPICSRSKDVIEPLLKPQWYVKCGEMARNALNAVHTNQLAVIPEMFIKTWDNWMENIRDWCISRQLWWGHSIPAYFVIIQGEEEGDRADNKFWVTGRTRDEAMEKAVKKFKVDKEKIRLEQDEDVLDTWFSSALFPFSVFGWPDQTEDLKTFYPSTLLETGHDILFFWVARMVFFGMELTGKLPFKYVYLHAMVRDSHGRKMSKSLGNVIDPIDVIQGVTLEALHQQLAKSNLDAREHERARQSQKEDYPNGIPECGTDALRFALCAYTAQGRDINLDVLRVQGYRNFCNKMWNAAKFTLMQLGEGFRPKEKFKLSGSESLMDRWILSRLGAAVQLCGEGFAAYDFPKATTACFNFWLYELCDIYLEALKPVMQGSDETQKCTSREVLYTSVDTALRLISPFMPFISEELWQRFPRRRPDTDSPSICVAEYPEAQSFPYADSELDKNVAFAMKVVSTVRSLRSDYDLTVRQKTDLYVECTEESLAKSLRDFDILILTLTSSNQLKILSPGQTPPGRDCAIATVSAECKVHLMLKGIIDPEKEAKKLEEKRGKLEAQLGKLREAASKADYCEKVPEEIRASNAEKARQLEGELSHLEEAMKAIAAMS